MVRELRPQQARSQVPMVGTLSKNTGLIWLRNEVVHAPLRHVPHSTTLPGHSSVPI